MGRAPTFYDCLVEVEKASPYPDMKTPSLKLARLFRRALIAGAPSPLHYLPVVLR